MSSSSAAIPAIPKRPVWGPIVFEEVSFVEAEGCFQAIWKGRSVGYLISVTNADNSVLLSDIVVYPKVEIRIDWIDRLIRKVRPHWGVIYPQKLGIGTELLTRFLDWCRKAHVREVFGNVTEAGFKECPFLPDWYRQHGFNLGPPDGRAEFFPVKFKIIWRPH